MEIANLQLVIEHASSKFSKPAQYKPSYGTAGFRTEAHLLHSTIFRCGILMAIRSLKTQQATGICITASHNPAPDNGVKLVEPSGEMLLQSYEPIADQLTSIEDDKQLAQAVVELMQRERIVPGGGDSAPLVLIAHDTRPSGPELAAAAAAGVSCIGGEARMLGLLTTPQLHWTVMRTNQGLPASESSYCSELSAAFLKLAGKASPPHVLFVDCANGVGGSKFAALAESLGQAGLLLRLRNTGDGVLNAECGSDFVQNRRILPNNFDELPPNSRCCAVDGDADRLVYFATPSEPGERIVLLDGDKIAALAAGLVKNLVARLPGQLSNNSVGVVQTAYANGRSTEYLCKCVGCEVAVTPTGVKHLHEAAHAFDAGIYFEANGHGTLLFKQSFLEALREVEKESVAAQELLALNGIINAAVGDAMSGILLVEAALRRKGWDLKQWSELYNDLPSVQLKVRVLDRTVIVTTDAERRVAEPASLQRQIDEAVKGTPSGRAFVRPSGTEDVVRIYAEAATQEAVNELALRVARMVHSLAGGVGDAP
jgi:phosphoacetylglucosamine mutase